jgi:hypothetical protein
VFPKQCPRCGQEVLENQNFCPACGSSIEDVIARAKKRRRRMRPRTVRVLGQAIATALGGAITGCIVGIFVYTFFIPPRGPVNVTVVVPRNFGEETSLGRINASALVPMADSTFLVVDDLTDDAFYELRFAPDGSKMGPLVRKPISGLQQGHVEDFEGATLVESGNRRIIVAVSSLEQNERENTEEGFVRVTIDDAGELRGETMPGFRGWIVSHFPELSETAGAIGALNVQGLTWDPTEKVFLMGVRYPTRKDKPLVISFRIKDPSGAWETSNLERVGTTALDMPAPGKGEVAKGVLDLARRTDTGEVYAILGDSVGKARHAALYAWDGNQKGTIRTISEVIFHPDMKPEGLAFGTIGGKPVAVIVDDDGGYQVVWQDQMNTVSVVSGQ